ncbi:MAG: hypothetical protein ACLPY1_23460 [Terracidiphilus sp.]
MPAAVTEKLAGWPGFTVTLTGWEDMVGAISTGPVDAMVVFATWIAWQPLSIATNKLPHPMN